MIMIHSPIEAINKLRVERIPNGVAVEFLKLTQVSKSNCRIVGLGKDGKIYTNELRDGTAYTIGSDLGPFLKAVARIGVIRHKDAREHIARTRDHWQEERRWDDVSRLQYLCRKLGLELTVTQRRKLK